MCTTEESAGKSMNSVEVWAVLQKKAGAARLKSGWRTEMVEAAQWQQTEACVKPR